MFQYPEVIVRQAIAAATRGTPLCVPGWMNKLTAVSVRFLPRRLVTWVSGAFFRPKRA